MIAVSSSGKSFRALADYLATGRSGEERDRVAWSAARNLPTDDPELAATFMRATAELSTRVEKPVYHLVLSFDPTDQVDRATMERVADRVLERLGLAGYQAVLVAHRDREHAHLHVMVNRVHPETGVAWERWKDQPIIQQVLREEERALGLREVLGTLTPERESVLPVGPERTAAVDERDPSVAARLSEWYPGGPGVGPSPVRSYPTRVAQLTHHLDTRDRVIELTREQYEAQLDARAAWARAEELDAAAARARAAGVAFDRALAQVYRDPARAHQAYLALVEAEGAGAATRTLSERPERLGALLAGERTRALRLVRGEDDGAARAAAPGAAWLGRLEVQALRTFGEVAAETRVRRLDAELTRELRELYADPAAARATLDKLAAERGIERAAELVREQPQSVGELRATLTEAPDQVSAHASRVAELLEESTKARVFASAAREKLRDAQLDAEPVAARAEVERAAAASTRVRSALDALPSRAELERRIADLVDRLSPREVRQLRRTVGAPRLALAMEIRTTIRDVALGRDDEV